MQISMAISSRSSDFLGSHSFTDNNRFRCIDLSIDSKVAITFFFVFDLWHCRRSRKVSLHGRKLGVCRCVSAQSAEETGNICFFFFFCLFRYSAALLGFGSLFDFLPG